MNITTKACLGATILFSIIGIVIGFSKKGAIGELKKKYDEAKGAEQKLTSKNSKIVNLENQIKTLTGARDAAKSQLASANEAANKAVNDAQKARDENVSVVKERDDAERDLKSKELQLKQAKITQGQRLSKIEELEAEVAKLNRRRPRQPAGGGNVTAKTPATPGTQGKVVVNNANQFVIIDIGENKGLVKGSILEVWNGAVFIGKITVVDPAPMGNPALSIANIDSAATTGTIAKDNIVKLVNR